MAGNPTPMPQPRAILSLVENPLLLLLVDGGFVFEEAMNPVSLDIWRSDTSIECLTYLAGLEG